MRAYTFRDWLNNKFWDEKDTMGRYVCNDSERFLCLVDEGKMTYATLNEIQKAQGETYEYVVTCTVESYRRDLDRHKVKSPDKSRAIRSLIEKLENYIEDNKEVYHDVVLPRLHRDMKLGAKFMIPEYYKKCQRNEQVFADIYTHAPYGVNLGLYETGKVNENSLEDLLSFPTSLQMKFVQMEARVQWLNELIELERMAGNKKYNTSEGIDDLAIDMITESLRDRYRGIESKVLAYESAGNWESAVRCAAWCEKLNRMGYLGKKSKNLDRKACTDFAQNRYNIDIKNQIITSKNSERKKHINNKVNKKPSLKSFFD